MERLRRDDAQRARCEIVAFKAQLASIAANAGRQLACTKLATAGKRGLVRWRLDIAV
jgi:hypothetical protein